MGKIRRQRKEFHFSYNSQPCAQGATSRIENTRGEIFTFMPQAYQHIFAGLNIPHSNVGLRNDDARTVISSSKSVFKNRSTSKEERRKLRHQTFIERIDAIEALKKINQKKKQKNCPINEENGVSSAAASVSIPQSSGNRTPILQKTSLKSRVKHKRMLKDIGTLEKIWENPAFKADPFELISEMVQERIEKEYE